MQVLSKSRAVGKSWTAEKRRSVGPTQVEIPPELEARYTADYRAALLALQMVERASDETVGAKAS